MAEKIKINPKWDNLSIDAAMARNSGMHYGDYIAARHEAALPTRRREENSPPKNCKYCGGLIPKTGKDSEFCCPFCEKKWNRNEKDANDRGAVKEEHKKFCAYCGAPLLGKQKLYCDTRCAYLFNQEKIKARKKAVQNKSRLCQYCGCEIIGAKSNYKSYCSEECKKAARYQRLKERRDVETDLDG